MATRTTAVAVLLTTFLCVTLGTARALQERTSPPPRPQGASPGTLADVLDRVRWDRRGAPLLVLNPQGTPIVRDSSTAAPAPLPDPVPPSGYRLTDIAPAFRRKLVRLGTLAVLAPEEMLVFNTLPGEPDLLSGMNDEQRFDALLSAINDAQRRKLCSEIGLSLDDLSDDLSRKLFLSILPEPLEIRPRDEDDEVPGYRERRTVLSPPVRERVRLRLERAAVVRLIDDQEPRRVMVRRGGFGRLPGSDVPVVRSGNVRDIARYIGFGTEFARMVPSRRKPGDLEYAAPALNASVPLEGAKSVRELIRRVGIATSIELHADPRVADLPVALKTAADPESDVPAPISARSGDVLEALAWAVTGTYRRVGPAFILTDDVEGIGARHARRAEWRADAYARSAHLWKGIEEARRKTQDLLKFPAGEALALPPDLTRRLGFNWDPHRPGGEEVAVADLPAAWRSVVAEDVSATNGKADEDNQNRPVDLGDGRPVRIPRQPKARADRVRVELRARRLLEIPGTGTVDFPLESDNAIGGAFLPLAAVPATVESRSVILPDALRTRALLISPRTAKEAAAAVRAAKARGMTHLWVAVPGTADTGPLVAAVRAGKEYALSVFAVCHLLRSPAEEADSAESERNPLGETAREYAAARRTSPLGQLDGIERDRWKREGDWLRADSEPVRERRKAFLARVAAVPDLAGLVLRDTAPPGYETASSFGQFSPTGWDFGYTTEMRLAFLRAEGADPVDLVRYNGTYPSPPFFPALVWQRPTSAQEAPTDLYHKWNAFRNARNVALLREVEASLRAVRMDLPLFVDDRTNDRWNPGWFMPLPRTGPVPDPEDELNLRPASGKVYRPDVHLPDLPPGTLYAVRLTDALYNPYAAAPARTWSAKTGEEYARFLRAVLPGPESPARGVVFDLSDVPCDEALALLAGLAPVTPK